MTHEQFWRLDVIPKPEFLSAWLQRDIPGAPGWLTYDFNSSTNGNIVSYYSLSKNVDVLSLMPIIHTVQNISFFTFLSGKRTDALWVPDDTILQETSVSKLSSNGVVMKSVKYMENLELIEPVRYYDVTYGGLTMKSTVDFPDVYVLDMI